MKLWRELGEGWMARNPPRGSRGRSPRAGATALKSATKVDVMVKNNKSTPATSPEAGISIIGMGMTLTGDCETDGTLRIDGTVNGNVHAGKAVMIGTEGLVDGNIYTQDVVIAGRVLGSIHAVSRLELQSTGYVSGEVEALRMQLAEGAKLIGQVSVGEPQGASSRQASARKKVSPGWPKPSAVSTKRDEQPTPPPAQIEGRPSQVPQQFPMPRPT